MNLIKKIVCVLSLMAIVAGIAPGLSAIPVHAEETEDAEFRAVWIAYYDFDTKKFSNAKEFTAYVDEMFDNVAGMGMNAVVVHVRPFGDAMYSSKYFPWSVYASGKQGKDPGFDPLEIMVTEAHERGLAFHAWLNPYRVTSTYALTDAEKAETDPDVQKKMVAERLLAPTNPARKYLTNSKTGDDRYVLAYHSQLYYNPAYSKVRKLITNGVKEIVTNYDVDGIHFDDYFYPAFSPETYTTYFDAPEYEAYVKKQTDAGKAVKSIEDWRKGNVNTLVKGVYKAVKAIDPDCVFGISPGGYIDYYKNDYWRWYVDYATWMGKKGYIDYICPQLYWSFNTLNAYPYYETLLKWEAALKSPSVKLYVGLPAYKMNQKVAISSSAGNDSEWYNQFTLANMITTARDTGKTSGFIFFDYKDMVATRNSKAVEKVIAVWDR